MKIALVNPPVQHNSRAQLASLALGYIASYLIKAGYHCQLYDFGSISSPASKLVNKYHLHDFDFVGIASYTHNFFKTIEIAQAIKKNNPEVRIVVGGYHASALSLKILEDFQCIDYIISEEGEQAFLNLLNTLSSSENCEGIQNLAYRIHNRTQINPIGEPIKDLDMLPFPKRDFVNLTENDIPYFYDHLIGKKRKVLHISSGRGCPHHCLFCCVSGGKGNKVRLRSNENVLEEMKTCMIKSKYEHLYFVDADFLIDEKRSLELLSRVHACWPDISFSFETRADKIVKYKNLLPQLADMGCTAINLGIESGSPDSLVRMGKQATIAQNEMAIHILRRIGITPQPFMIMFEAELTLSDLSQNLNFLKKTELYGTLPISSILGKYLLPLPGTPYRRLFEKKFGHLPNHRLPDPFFKDSQVKRFYHLIYEFITKTSAKIDRFSYEVEKIKLELMTGDMISPQKKVCAKTLQLLVLLAATLYFRPYFLFERLINVIEKNLSIDWLKQEFQYIEKTLAIGLIVLKQLEAEMTDQQ